MSLNDLLKVGDNIKRIRKEKGISQKDMAEIFLKIPRSTYSNYENNNRVPDLDLLNRIAEILKVSVAELTISKDLLEQTKDILDQFNEQGSTSISPPNNEALVPSFQSIFLTLGYPGVLNYSDITINQVLFSDEFRDHTFYLLEKYSKEEL